MCMYSLSLNIVPTTVTQTGISTGSAAVAGRSFQYPKTANILEAKLHFESLGITSTWFRIMLFLLMSKPILNIVYVCCYLVTLYQTCRKNSLLLEYELH